MTEITEQQAMKNLNDFRRLGTAVLEEKEKIIDILIESGLTEAGANLDLTLLQKQMNSMGSEIHRIVGRVRKDGKFACQIAYDVPNFLTAFYCGPAFVTGMQVLMRFPSTQMELGKIWQQKIKENNIENISVEIDKSGKDFGIHCVENDEIKHFVIVGGQKIVDFYDKKEVMDKLDTLLIFGPDLPKAIFLESLDNETLPALVKNTVTTAFFNSGQICALEKELIVDDAIYDRTKELLIKEVSSITFGTHKDHVGPITNTPTFNRMKEVIDFIKEHPNDFRILCGGEIEENLIKPTLVEIIGEFDHSVDYFGPMIFLKRVMSKEDAIAEVKKDIYHGGNVYVHGGAEDIFEVEGMLKERIGNVKLNANVMNESIDWPYGAYGKYSFILKTREPTGIVSRKGKVYLSHVLTK
ncbi:aldehyde dehydrogenase family protein [Candidatus Aenigmatarchaeota archaeon]